VIEELIQLAKDMRTARARGEETGLTDEKLRSTRRSPVDPMNREAAGARMRVLVKRLLRKYGYPPDLRDAAVQRVLQQAEALSAEWAAQSHNREP
jgi:type I restriction enzyme R subunit